MLYHALQIREKHQVQKSYAQFEIPVLKAMHKYCLFSHRNMNVYVQTGLPAGTYCDVISGQKENNKCTGKQVFVSGDGMANFQINTDAEDPFIAIHVDAKL